jgi:hypothetical protein
LKQQFSGQNKNQKPANPFYHANLEALRMHYPDIARLVSKTPPNPDYETISTKSGAATNTSP